MGTIAKIFPVASVNRKPSGSRPEWRLATSGARVFAAAIASSLVAKTQISFSTGIAPRSQSIENTAGSSTKNCGDVGAGGVAERGVGLNGVYHKGRALELIRIKPTQKHMAEDYLARTTTTTMYLGMYPLDVGHLLRPTSAQSN
jgi:hypothetical protein